MKEHAITIIAVLLSAITGGATFLFALYRQFALLEVAASIAIGLQLYFLSSSVGDVLEDKDEPSRVRLVLAVSVAGAVVAYGWSAGTCRAEQPYAKVGQRLARVGAKVTGALGNSNIINTIRSVCVAWHVRF
jgi:hypothetical protein